MPRRFEKKHRPFISLPRHKRNDVFIKLKGEIKREVKSYSGMFTSPLVLDESRESQWCDFYFLGLDKFTIWNAEIITAKQALDDAVSDLAYSRTFEMLTPEELDVECKIEYEPADRCSKTGKLLTYRMIRREPKHYAKFGGLTFSEQKQKLKSEIIEKTPPTIYESFQIDFSYRYGIGLEIVLDADAIHRKEIEQAIMKFRELGEKNWQAPNPVPRERLTIKQEK
jgi:hypothetical protein